MATPIVMPKFGQMTEESSIVEWRKHEGDTVARGDILFTVETDKSVMDVESFEAGTLLKILVRPGVSVPVQSTVGFLGEPGDPVPEVQPTAPRPAVREKTPSVVPQAIGGSGSPAAVSPAPVPAAEAVFRISPRAVALARECLIDPAPIRGTGPAGRILEKDVRAYLEARGYARLRISHAARQLAAREQIDLLSLAPGHSGRIEVADIQRAIAERPRPLSRMRQVIAQRLTQSVVTAPHFFVTVEVDMTGLVELRTALKAKASPLTVTDFIAHATVLALKEFPDLNSSTDGRSIRWNSRVHLGLAVSLEQGLVVPVIRHADELYLAELSSAARDIADKARAGKLTPDEMTGSTFTISNMGMLDVENFTAIINPGEAAILAVSSTRKKPVVRGDQIVVRSIMKITLSSDHRIVDGALAARFLNAIKQKLENLELWKTLTS